MPKTIEELEKKIKTLEDEKKELSKPFDISKLTDDQIDKVFEDERIWKHPRFKALNEKAKEGEKIAKEKSEADLKKLEEDKKFEEALKMEKEKNQKLESELKQSSLDSVIRASASKLGALNPETVLKLVDRSKIVVKDDGSVEGVEEALKGLAENDKYLFDSTTLANGTNPANNNATPKFKQSQISNVAFYQEHETEILEAMKTGQIEQDM
ncbi:phage scaffolding protein [Patescibacteria group bacterium]|nr:phage scaffolding protein [Patescibacteria group bacterium]